MSSNPEQCAQALAYGNVVRASNKLAKDTLRNTERVAALRHAAKVVQYPVGHEDSLRIGQYLMAVPFMGRGKMMRLLAPYGIDSHAKLRRIPVEVRAALSADLQREAYIIAVGARPNLVYA